MPLVHKDYFRQKNVVFLARDLIGKVLITNSEAGISAGIITETEAYNGIVDRACHAYGGLRSARTETMYGEGGQSYVYLCYGIHHLFNIVVSEKDDPKAVLIRGIQPLEGLDLMLSRRNRKKLSRDLFLGPGKVSQALGISTADNGKELKRNFIWVEDRGIKIKAADILCGPRIGVDYAGEDAKLPYRFWLKGEQSSK